MKSLKKTIAKEEAVTAQRVVKRKQAKEVCDTHYTTCIFLLLLTNSSIVIAK